MRDIKFTDRQLAVANLYIGGRRTQAEVAKELGLSQATVARELRRVRARAEGELREKARRARRLAPDAEAALARGSIGRATAYRRTATAWGYAPDKATEELKAARRATNRARKLIEATGGETAPEALAELRALIGAALACLNLRKGHG